MAEDLPELDAHLRRGARARLRAARRAADHERHGRQRTELEQLVAACQQRPEIAAIELNVSCPNVRTGLDIGADPAQLGEVAAARFARTPTSR